MTEANSAPKEFDGRITSGKDWREIIAWVGDLPPMPHVASRAISMVENPDTTAPELTELLKPYQSTEAPTAGLEALLMPTKQGGPQSDCWPDSELVVPSQFSTVEGKTLHCT